MPHDCFGISIAIDVRYMVRWLLLFSRCRYANVGSDIWKRNQYGPGVVPGQGSNRTNEKNGKLLHNYQTLQN